MLIYRAFSGCHDISNSRRSRRLIPGEHDVPSKGTHDGAQCSNHRQHSAIFCSRLRMRLCRQKAYADIWHVDSHRRAENKQLHGSHVNGRVIRIIMVIIAQPITHDNGLQPTLIVLRAIWHQRRATLAGAPKIHVAAPINANVQQRACRPTLRLVARYASSLDSTSSLRDVISLSSRRTR